MFNSEKYYQLGSLLRTHGVKGGLVLEVDFNISDNEIKNLELVFILIDNLPVPFFIEEIKTYTKNRFIVKFFDINDIDSADELCVNKALIEKTQFPDYKPQLSIEDLVGYTVFTNDETKIGLIEEFIDINLNPTFKIINNNEEILIPANPDFITEINEEKKILFVDLPEGLIDLN